jgi:hypothetical protein
VAELLTIRLFLIVTVGKCQPHDHCERADDLLVLLGPVGSQENPDSQLSRLDFRVVAIVQHGVLDHAAGEPRPHLRL